MKEYYHILELEDGSSLRDIKRAFRRLAKEFHPDISQTQDSSERFVEITEAYEFLTNEELRASYLRMKQRKISEEELYRREQLYKDWVNRQQEVVRKQARNYASVSYDTFSESSVFKTAMVVSKVYNYIFVAIGLFMAFGPFLWMITHPAEDPEEQRPLWMAVFPMIFGVFFTYGIYTFLFKYKDND